LAPTNALDSAPLNNIQQAGSLRAFAAIVGDINGNGNCDIFDAIQLALVFGKKSTDIGYNKDADLNSNGVINIFDAILLANNFGKHVP